MSSPTNLNAHSGARAALDELERVILGKPTQVRLALACLLARGHLLIEDLPGVGKTTLAHGLAGTLGLQFARVQFTSDLLPADLTGVSVFERESGSFRFHEGPVFTQLLLADEINRATPKTQSALLEAMEERQVSEGGVTRPLPEPFFVIATQNPLEQVGTFPLPEAQLDRFLMTVTLGYPDVRAERALLAGGGGDRAAGVTVTLPREPLLDAQRLVEGVYVSDALLDYVQLLLAATRDGSRFVVGLSPRAALGLMRAARAWAWLAGRDMVLPEDIQAVFPSVAVHRLPDRATLRPNLASVRALLAATPVP
ncbi:AAA family ATPase [Deinococcus maricopensis]|uniref:ATPase associated with various cellular activities AAA_3 n=1 Tax=Deinococcus maricopensis (strain DSM 21211 / LMG 22137 / NRRL B-23946 / LB-34) TaxID=709986 RepID=E8U6E3_DEIML|nr:AAA family ATPase [Deinococcus maricopensis]ADV66632.1 ATPase associated with various cellular activities AAA_3 [Deinococcus maricopensis DSM 21211]